MKSRASIGNHPIHSILVAFPIALWVFSFIADLVYHFGSQNLFWKAVALYTMFGGVIGALAAAVPGLIDYGGIINDRVAKRIATTHLSLNLIAVALFILNLYLRVDS